MSDWSDEETDEPLVANHRNFYKVEKWGKDEMRVVERSVITGTNPLSSLR